MKVFIYTMVIDGKLKIKIRLILKIFLLNICTVQSSDV